MMVAPGWNGQWSTFYMHGSRAVPDKRCTSLRNVDRDIATEKIYSVVSPQSLDDSGARTDELANDH